MISTLNKRFISVSFLSIIIFAFAFPIKADLPFRNHRFDSFKVLPPHEEGDIVFIGNSITNMMNWNELFVSGKIKNRGTSGAYTKEILKNLESLTAGNPSKIFLMIGTNDLATDGTEFTPEAVAYRINKILESIRKEVPQAMVYFQSILPSNLGLRTPEKTETTNTLVKNWINNQNDDKLVYIDLNTPEMVNGLLNQKENSSSEEALSFDGLHLTQKGYKIWADIIKKHVNHESVLKKEYKNISMDLKGSNGMRTSYFGVFPIKSSDILLIGDEMIHGGEWHELIGSQNFKDRGIGWGFPGINLKNVINIIPAILKQNNLKGVSKAKPKAICIYAGMADVQNGATKEEFEKNYKTLLHNLRSILPSTPIFFLSLCPPTSESSLKDEIVEVNGILKEMADQNKNTYFIDIFQSLSEADGGRDEVYFMEKSSPYLNGMGYVQVAKELTKELNSVLGSSYISLSDEQALDNFNFSENCKKNSGRSFIVFDNKASEIPYRIPAIAKNRSGDIIAVADYRYAKADIGMVKNGKLDLHYRIKDADTGEWSEVKTLAAAFGEGDDNIAFGDPCIVADRESDLVLVTSCSGNVSFPKGTHDNHQGLARFYSEDGGKTWGEYEEIGDQLLNILDKRSDGPINAFFIGSGKIMQSNTVKTGDYYRLYCSALVRVNDGKTRVNYVFYSDDFGKNWNLLGDIDDCPIPFGADEPKTEELPDGSVLVSSRISGGRAFNIFHFDNVEKAMGKWDTMAISNADVNGIVASSNDCNGETLCVPVIREKDGIETYLLLQSVPMNMFGERANVGINYKDLGSIHHYSDPEKLAADWDGQFEVSPYSSAYSTMTIDKDNDIAFFYEENGFNSGFDMVYRKLTIEDITNGKYSFNSNALKH